MRYVCIRRAEDQYPYEIRESKTDDQPLRADYAEFFGHIQLVYNQEEPLGGGAPCWLEVDEHVISGMLGETIIVSVLRETIILNANTGKRFPPFEIRKTKDDPNPERVMGAEYLGRVQCFYDPNKPFGPSFWLEIQPIR